MPRNKVPPNFPLRNNTPFLEQYTLQRITSWYNVLTTKDYKILLDITTQCTTIPYNALHYLTLTLRKVTLYDNKNSSFNSKIRYRAHGFMQSDSEAGRNSSEHRDT
jgi:hypothetical protein